MNNYEYVIIGMGPGGIALAINLNKQGKNVVVIEKSAPGGKVNLAPRIDNYPGYPKINGPDLAYVLFERFNQTNIPAIYDEVKKVSRVDNHFLVELIAENITADKVIVASGTVEKEIGLDSEKKFFGHGLSYCAICDGHFYKNQKTMVVAEDKYALHEAIYLAGVAKEVVIVTSKDKLVGEKRRLEELATLDNVKYIYNHHLIKLNGEDKLTSVILDNGEEIMVNGLFPLMGYIPNTQFLPKEVLSEDGFINVDKNYQTSIEGLYAIGDVINRELKQIYLAEADANNLTKVLLG